ncbi:2-oxo acid dehydrogenase subunit E2, partial [Streptomyces sp. GC420]|uniref:2-oxo acid dehydrogenase subunit E2 n=1 Tax=Streptomyces sp. GC420 TaxID=2697568 RepID=UPI001414DE37
TSSSAPAAPREGAPAGPSAAEAATTTAAGQRTRSAPGRAVTGGRPRGGEPSVTAAGVPAAAPAGPQVRRGGTAAAGEEPAAGPLVRRLAAERGIELGALHGTGPGGRVTRADVTAAQRPPGRVRATPYARRLARELAVDLSGVPGTGEHGAVRAADVRAAAAVRVLPPTHVPEPSAAAEGRAGEAALGGAGREAGAVRVGSRAAPARPTQDRDASMRRAIGDLMSRSKREIPHYYLSTTVDMSAAVEWMRRHNRDHPVAERLVPAALLLRAAALAAREVPRLNGHWEDDGFVPGAGVHLGVAVSLHGGGLMAPALRDADTLNPAEMMSALKDLVRRARTGRLRGSEVSGATITVTNLGDQGVEAVFGVIYPPQVALVGFGRVVERPWAVDGLIGVRPVVTATISADHRASDGAVGARYLAAVDRLLQKPEEL